MEKHVWDAECWEWHGFDLVDNFTVKQWDPKTQSYYEVDVDPETPKNNRDELLQLKMLQDWLYQRYVTPIDKGLDGKQEFGDNNKENDYKIWYDDEMWNKFDESIDRAVKWMFTIQELTPEK